MLQTKGRGADRQRIHRFTEDGGDAPTDGHIRGRISWDGRAHRRWRRIRCCSRGEIPAIDGDQRVAGQVFDQIGNRCRVHCQRRQVSGRREGGGHAHIADRADHWCAPLLQTKGRSANRQRIHHLTEDGGNTPTDGHVRGRVRRDGRTHRRRRRIWCDARGKVPAIDGDQRVAGQVFDQIGNRRCIHCQRRQVSGRSKGGGHAHIADRAGHRSGALLQTKGRGADRQRIQRFTKDCGDVLADGHVRGRIRRDGGTHRRRRRIRCCSRGPTPDIVACQRVAGQILRSGGNFCRVKGQSC